MAQKTKDQILKVEAETRSVAASIKKEDGPLPWERQPGESFAAYSRFVMYRNTSPATRSMRKLGVSGTTAFRWAKRFNWTARASEYDLWQLELSDGLANQNELVHRSRAVRLSSAFIRKATDAATEADASKMTVEDIVALGEAGVKIERQALQMGDARPNVHAAAASVSVSFGLGQPDWMPKQTQNATTIEQKQNEIPVLPGEKVLDEGSGIRTRTVCPNRNDKLPGRQLVRLAEKIVPSPPTKRSLQLPPAEQEKVGENNAMPPTKKETVN